MKKNIRLSDAEFTIMKAVWTIAGPASTADIMHHLDEGTQWKPQTVLTLLSRLITKEFVGSKKEGKERQFWALVTEEEYLESETSGFFKRYHKNSITGLVNSLYNGDTLKEDDMDELRRWLEERKKK